MKKSLIFLIIILLILSITLIIFGFIDKIPAINQSTKTCLVTGASSGIGKEISREMLKKGWKVIGIARREEKLKELKGEFRDSFVYFKCDVSDLDQVTKISEKIKKQGLKPTLFFLNAGAGDPEVKFQLFVKNQKQVFDTNYFGVISWVENWLNEVKNYGGGNFVATSSIASIISGPGGSGYGASKAAINLCFRSLGLQYYSDKIGFSVVLPGPVDTDMLKGVVKKLPFTHTAEYEAKYIVKKVFERKRQIEPSLFYSCVVRVLSWLPDKVLLKFYEKNN